MAFAFVNGILASVEQDFQITPKKAVIIEGIILVILMIISINEWND